MGKIIHRLFPQVTAKRVRSKSTWTKLTTMYHGIVFDPTDKVSESDKKLTSQQIAGYLPDTALVYPKAGRTNISFGIRSLYLCNGNAVLKNVNVADTKWELEIRGQTISLEQYGINNYYGGTQVSLNALLETVNTIKLCRGIPEANLEKKFNDINHSRKFIRENESIIGDENSTQVRIRSLKCLQITGLHKLSEDSCCRRCQVDLIIRNTKPTNKLKVTDEPAPKEATNQSFEDEIELDEEDHNSLLNLLEEMLPGASDSMKTLLLDQRAALKAKDKRCRRWSSSVISLCLNMFIRSPKMYDDLKDSHMLILPSGRQLSRYNNFIPQTAGLNRSVLEWMYHSAVESKIPKHGWAGGLIHDETKIQTDLVLTTRNGTPKLIGWIDTGNEGRDLKILREGNLKRKLATEVFQIIFFGYTGLRFPVYHCPSAGINASDMAIIIHKVIAELHDYDFQVDFILQDGGQENRQFMKAHFRGDPQRFKCPHTFDPNRQLMMSQDFSHNIKKLGNSLISSGTVAGRHTRHLMRNGLPMVWQQWADAVIWDRNTNGRLIHYKVTDTHIFPNGAEKMRNHLAEDMLDGQMLNLMRQYQVHIILLSLQLSCYETLIV